MHRLLGLGFANFLPPISPRQQMPPNDLKSLDCVRKDVRLSAEAETSAISPPPPPPPPVPRAPVRPSQKNAIPEEPKPALKTSKLANWVSFFIAVVIMTVIWALTDYKLPWWRGFIAVLIIQGVLLTAWNMTKKKK